MTNDRLFVQEFLIVEPMAKHFLFRGGTDQRRLIGKGQLLHSNQLPCFFKNPRLTAHFHIKYLKRMLEERNMRYSKNDTEDVCTKAYLEQLIKRYKNTGHIPSFGSWYEFIASLSKL